MATSTDETARIVVDTCSMCERIAAMERVVEAVRVFRTTCQKVTTLDQVTDAMAVLYRELRAYDDAHLDAASRDAGVTG